MRTPAGAPALSRPWLAGALGFGLSVWLLQPGFMSWDSAEQWRQARLGQYDDVFPPLMAMLWRQVDRVVEGPFGMLALQALLYWAALSGIVSRLPGSEGARACLVLVLGLWPPLFGLLGHIWKDVWVMALFALAVWALRVEQERPAVAWRAAALLALLLACAFRHNAITGAVPLLAFWAWRTLRARGVHPGRAAWRVAGLTVVACVLVHLGLGLPARHPSVRRVSAIWSAVALWDMAAVSIREERLVFPPGFADPALTLGELQGYFRDYSNTTIFQTGHLRLSFHRPYGPGDAERLFAAWLRLPRDHGPAWARHRLRLCALLFGWDRPGLPDFQVFQFVRHEMEGNPALHARPPWAQRYVAGGLQSLADTPLFAGWMYLLLAAATAIRAGFRRRRPEAALAAAVALSALSYALPLALVSGSAEFRYLAWPLLAALLAPLLLARPRGTPPGLAAGPALGAGIALLLGASQASAALPRFGELASRRLDVAPRFRPIPVRPLPRIATASSGSARKPVADRPGAERAAALRAELETHRGSEGSPAPGHGTWTRLETSSELTSWGTCRRRESCRRRRVPRVGATGGRARDGRNPSSGRSAAGGLSRTAGRRAALR